jgi:hypothetical protein
VNVPPVSTPIDKSFPRQECVFKDAAFACRTTLAHRLRRVNREPVVNSMPRRMNG